MQNELDSPNAAYCVNYPITTVNPNLFIGQLTEINLSSMVVVPGRSRHEGKSRTLYAQA